MNFGGPGTTGQSNTVYGALTLPETLGSEHDLISWAPRGTSGQHLRFICYKDDTERKLARQGGGVYGSLNTSSATLGRLWALGTIKADTCYERAGDAGNWIGTAFTARDAMQIVDALQQGPMLNYYGASYGTLLGVTLAAMFPDRIGRMVLDGQVNPHEYYHGYLGLESIHDADAAFRAFLSECVSAGSERCPLASRNLTGAALEPVILWAIESTNSVPITLPPALLDYQFGISNNIIDSRVFEILVHDSLYSPSRFQEMATVLDSLLTLRETNATNDRSYAALTQWASSGKSTSMDSIQDEDFFGIRCGDKMMRASSSAQMLPVIEQSLAVSKLFGSRLVLSGGLSECTQWRFHAKERYEGDFQVETAYPVLLVGSTYDPVTPLVSSWNVSSGLRGSVVLERRGFGHTSLAQTSTCSNMAIAAYFTAGVVPANGTVCEPDAGVFDVL